MPPKLSVCLLRPLIALNTGNVGRTCLGFDTALHLVKPLGFDLSEKAVRRSGLDYWNDVNVTVHETWEEFADTELHEDKSVDRVLFFSKSAKYGSQSSFQADMSGEHVMLVFGNETQGMDFLPPSVLAQAAASTLPDDASFATSGTDSQACPGSPRWQFTYVPMAPAIRSFNLANTVAMACYEARRQQSWPESLDEAC